MRTTTVERFMGFSLADWSEKYLPFKLLVRRLSNLQRFPLQCMTVLASDPDEKPKWPGT